VAGSLKAVVLLAAFAFVAGAGTALSPCVLPILPAVLSAGVTGGRRRPLGLVIGLGLSFAFAIVGLVYVIDALGLPGDLVRTLAIAVLLGFGLALIAPPIADRIEAALSRLVPAFRVGRGEGFWSGVGLGASLGVVYAPCAGPILAGVITASAAQEFTAGKLAVALAYAAGSAVVLYVLVLGGRRLTDRLARFRGRIQVAMGVVMVTVAGLMLADLDLRFQRAVAENLPAFLRNPATPLEESEAVTEGLASISGSGHGAVEGGATAAESGERLPVLGPAPEIVPGGEWFNTEPLSLSGLQAERRVALIDFWTYTCINCIRTFPELRSWHEEYGDDGLTILGVHTPEFPFEREAANVERAIDDFDIDYPVVQDNAYATWNAFANRYWPAKYLIDAEGNVRYAHFGEGAYGTTERAIRSLLAEAGRPVGAETDETRTERADPRLRTPETYLGAARAEGFVNGPIRPGTKDFRAPPPASLSLNEFAYEGPWRIGLSSARSLGAARLSLGFQARRVFLVAGSAGPARELEVRLDGSPIEAAAAGEDVDEGVARIGEQRLYRLVELDRAGRHTLSLGFEPGISGFAFTFG
jgi:cytochrome c biogenesis protein CcdA/thiol-disulfide isomerase/thioredoxin